MKLIVGHKSFIAGVIALSVLITACTTDQVIDNSVAVAAGTTKVVAKGEVGAGKLAYNGAKKGATIGN